MSTELAQRLVACPKWRWMAGMRGIVVESGAGFFESHDTFPGRVYLRDGDGLAWQGEPRGFFSSWPPPWGVLPDLDDPATIGCLLALVREAGPFAWIQPYYLGDVDGWAVFPSPSAGWRSFAATEAEALVAALEAAP